MTRNAAIVIARQAISGECIKGQTARSTIVRVKHRLHEIVPRNTTGRMVSADAKRLDTDAVQKMLEASAAPDGSRYKVERERTGKDCCDRDTRLDRLFTHRFFV